MLTTIGSGSTITYTDTGSAGTSASVPSSNTATLANLNTFNGMLNGCTLGNGEILSWATPGAAGITVSSTSHIVHIQNNDTVNHAAWQWTVIGGTA